MIRLKVNKKIYSYERLIFPIEKIKNSNADVLRYMRYKNSNLLGKVEDEHSLTPITDLTLSYEEIYMQYDKKLRNQVKRAAKEEIGYELYDCIDVKKDEQTLKDIAKKYYDFCDALDLPEMKHNLEWDEFVLFVENNNLIISKAYYENGWVYHIYQCDGKTAMLWFSFSDYRKQEGGNKQLPGWANRSLHDSDIQYFKKQGYTEYDWGNISSLEEPNNIDKFKMSFGGEIVPVYSSFVGNSLKGKILVWLRSMKTSRNRN